MSGQIIRASRNDPQCGQHFYWWECDCFELEEPLRIIACSCCGGDGGGFEGGNERWIKCVACDGKGEFEAELEPLQMEDLR